MPVDIPARKPIESQTDWCLRKIRSGSDISWGSSARCTVARPFLQPATCEKHLPDNRRLISDCYGGDEGNIEDCGIPLRAAVNLAAFTSASGSFAAAVRGVYNPNRRSGRANARFEIEILCVRMKEQDA